MVISHFTHFKIEKDQSPEKNLVPYAIDEIIEYHA